MATKKYRHSRFNCGTKIIFIDLIGFVYQLKARSGRLYKKRKKKIYISLDELQFFIDFFFPSEGIVLCVCVRRKLIQRN